MMEGDIRTHPEQNPEDLAASLRCLLEEQRAAGQEGDFTRMIQLGELADAVVARIVRQGGEAPVALDDVRHDLKGLYDELILMLRAEQADVQGKLKQLRRVQRAVGAYRNDH